MEPRKPNRSVLLRRPAAWPEARFVAEALRTETVGGALLIAAAAVALIWANSPWRDAYETLRTTVVGPEALHLDLTLETWAADGLLAIFFFVVGLELKRELVVGDLSEPARAVVPVVAALGGIAVPAVLYVLVNLGSDGALDGWAIPTATDIAFALAVLAVMGSHLPAALRSFLLTLAVVDDLVAILVIAVVYTSTLSFGALAGSLGCVAVFALLVRRTRPRWPVAAVVGVAAWVLMHESGVHATIAGVLLGFVIPVHRADGSMLIEDLEHRWRPISAGFAVPLFAFFAAGVTFVDGAGLGAVVSDPVALGIAAGLVLGKPVGILGATWLTARLTRASLDDDLTWGDMLGLGLVGGIGFTVSLLIAELAFDGTDHLEHAKLAILVASVVSAGLGAVVLVRRNAAYRELETAEAVDADHDDIPDVYEVDD